MLPANIRCRAELKFIYINKLKQVVLIEKKEDNNIFKTCAVLKILMTQR